MNRTNKAELAATLKDKFSKAQVAIFADYKGLSASAADRFRRELRVHKAEVKVLKNNIARRVTADGSFGPEAKAILDATVGPTLVAFGYQDAAGIAKTVHKFAQDNEALTLKDSLLGRNKITPADIEQLAKLPSKEVLIAMFLGVLNAPARNFVSVLAAVPRGLVTVLAAVQKKKEESGGAA